ncbi:MAG: peptidase M64, partial [Bacteroidales bacterium]|nr:peptidase M64 [Bacteroidales bacterium]
NFYPLDVEPWEPNITTLVNFESKWKNMISKDTPVPTPPTDEFKDVVGLFEGGGYSAKGIYRPKIECTMRMNTPQGLCPVCQNAIRKMIEFYTK